MRDDVVTQLVAMRNAVNPFKKLIAVAALAAGVWVEPTSLRAACDCQWANACYSEGGHVCYQGTDYLCSGAQWLGGGACS